MTGTWQSPEYNVEVRTNALGFRDEEFVLPPDPTQFVVACLGDSMAMGQGVDQEQGHLHSRGKRTEQEASGGADRIIWRSVVTLRARRFVKSNWPESWAHAFSSSRFAQEPHPENDNIVIRGIGADHFRSDGDRNIRFRAWKNSPPTWMEEHFRLYSVLKSAVHHPAGDRHGEHSLVAIRN